MTPVFFTDRDLGKRFPEVLHAAGLAVERHADHFAPDCPDEVWLEAVGRKGWIAVTHDRRIRYKPNELAAVVQHRVALLVVIGDAPTRCWPRLSSARLLASCTSSRTIGRRTSPRCIDRLPAKLR